MRQVCISRYGAPEVLRLQEAPEPRLTAHTVRIAVHAIGINFADIMARQGLYPDCPKPPVVVGYEVAGRVTEVGSEVTTLVAGQAVLALTHFGGYANQVVVPSSQVFPLPEAMPFAEAAALPVNYLTAALMLYHCGRLQSGERVLIHGAAGGVGLAAVQLCRVRQAEVYATASVAKHAFLQQQGIATRLHMTPKPGVGYRRAHGRPGCRHRSRPAGGAFLCPELPLTGAFGAPHYIWCLAHEQRPAAASPSGAVALPADATFPPRAFDAR